MSIRRRISKLNEVARRRQESVERKLQTVLRVIPRETKELAMDALAMKFRGYRLSKAEQEALDVLEASGYFEAVEKSLQHETDRDRERAAELTERMGAGEDWREIKLEV